MSPWFYMPQLPQVGETAALDAREAKHATGARRLGVGDDVCVFDGMGNIAHARITSATGREVALEVNRIEQQSPPAPSVHLAAALPKGDRQGVLLSMATQLGMSAFTPLHCARSIVKPGAAFAERAQRIFIESCKQSRRAHLPASHESAGVAALANQAAARGEALILAHPGGRPAGPALREAAATASHVLLLVGPEGGFTEQEVAAVGPASVVGLGAGVLRVETAAVALLALLRHG